MLLETYFQLVILCVGIVSGVEFGARMITIDGKQIKLQIWDTVSIAGAVAVHRLEQYGR
jgi:GTPase SAR1 family protein